MGVQKNKNFDPSIGKKTQFKKGQSGNPSGRNRLPLTAILKELEALKKRGTKTKELSRAKDYLLGQIAMSLEMPQGRMWHFARDYLTIGKIYDFKELKRKIDIIAESQIKSLAKKTFTFENMCVSCVGNIEEGLSKKLQRAVG